MWDEGLPALNPLLSALQGFDAGPREGEPPPPPHLRAEQDFELTYLAQKGRKSSVNLQPWRRFSAGMDGGERDRELMVSVRGAEIREVS